MVKELGNREVELHGAALRVEDHANAIGSTASQDMGFNGAEAAFPPYFLAKPVEDPGIAARADQTGNFLAQRRGQRRLCITGNLDTLDGVTGIDVVLGNQAKGRLLIPACSEREKKSSPEDERA